MRETLRSPSLVNLDADVADLHSRVQEAERRLSDLRIPTYRHFKTDLLQGSFGPNISKVEAILDLVEKEQPGILVTQTDKRTGIEVVKPEGEFTIKGFSGILIAIGFPVSYGNSTLVTIDRTFYDPNERFSHFAKERVNSLHSRDELKTIVNPHRKVHQAEYQNGQLTTLTHQTGEDSTSSHVLKTTYDPRTRRWTSTYQAPYATEALPLEPNGEMVPRSIFKGSNRLIGLGEIYIEEEELIVEVLTPKAQRRKKWLTTLAAPLEFPWYLLPPPNSEECIDWLTDNWNDIYPPLHDRIPVITAEETLLAR